jgi:hypothetical protein
MRDIIYATKELERLSKEFSLVEAIYAVNKISQEYLIRPMGIFQLIDYVGIDVCSYIMSVMRASAKDIDLHSPLLDRYLSLGIKGGQFADGSQKDGFLKYEKGKVTGVFDPDKKEYIKVADIQAKVDEKLGKMPAAPPWKSVISNPGKEEQLKAYFTELKSYNSPGAKLALSYAGRSKEIGQFLVKSGVAFSEKDVNTVLLTGFYHAYGPIQDYLN